MSIRNKVSIVGITVGLLVALGLGAALWLSRGSAETFKLLNFSTGTFKHLNPATLFDSRSGDTAASATPLDESAAPDRYVHSVPAFSFDHPEGFTISSFEESDGEVILAEGGGASGGFQIFISPFDEPFDPAQGRPGPITPERIRHDLPEMAIHEPQNSSIGGAGALVFFSEDPSLGKLREVWFSHGGYLYQVTAPAAFDEELSKIMATFAF